MATVKFSVRGKKNPSKISLRFAEGNFSTIVTTPLSINPLHFSNTKGVVKNVVEAENKDGLNKKLRKLKDHVIDQLNEDASQGIYIDSQWVKKSVDGYFNRTPKTNKDYKIFLVDYCNHFIETSNERYTKKKDQESKPIADRTVKKYKTLLTRLQEFEKKENVRHKLTEIDLTYYRRFVSFLRVDQAYNDNTIGKYIGALKTVLNDAIFHGINVPPQVKKFEVYTASTHDTYLTDAEIDKIFDLKLTNLRLKNARDLFIIGLRTGLRVSDFTRLNEANIKGDFLEIVTLKTGKMVVIPIHPQLQVIIDNGLPHAITEQRLNDYIKEICELAGIKQMVEGAKINPETKRKEKGVYPKYELISTHTCRRSFATNLYGKIPNYTIMAITGHTKETTFLKYIKITDKENAIMLQNYWKKSMSDQGYKPEMKVI